MGRTLSFTWCERRNHGKAEARLALQNSLGESPGWKESDKSRDQWGRGMMMIMGVARMAITEVGLGSYVPGALCTQEVGGKKRNIVSWKLGQGRCHRLH